MLTEIRVFARAKINLGLKVLPLRSDGFHDIESIFQTVDFADELLVRLSDGCGKCTVHCRNAALPQENTITSAYRAFVAAAGRDIPGVSVELIKRIPAGGGLGGGSSDAASFIRALEKLSGVVLTDSQLDEVASGIGSDVFFFLHCDENGRGCAVVSGRGENIRNIQPRLDLYFLLVFPGVHSSTKEAYALVDEELAGGRAVLCPAFEELETVYNSPVQSWTFANSFTPALAGQYPEISAALRRARESGALYAELSGSGSTIFGVFTSEEEAKKAVDFIVYQGMSCALCGVNP